MQKIKLVLENAMQRYQIGGFLKGDVIEFTKGWKSKDSYKNLPDPLKEYLVNIEKSEVMLYVERVLNSLPGSDHNSRSQDGNSNVELDIGIEIGSGRIVDRFRAPGNLFNVLKNDGTNASLYNYDRFKYESKLSHEKEERGVDLGEFKSRPSLTDAKEFLDSFD